MVDEGETMLTFDRIAAKTTTMMRFVHCHSLGGATQQLALHPPTLQFNQTTRDETSLFQDTGRSRVCYWLT